jgi:hypothetical protein
MPQRTTLWLGGLIASVLLVTLFFAVGSNAAATCHGNGVRYVEVIHDSKLSSVTIHGKLCDIITFVNKDNISRAIAFGPHEDHVPYDGVGEKILNHNQRFTITLNQPGTFHWHDHEHDNVGGYFTVNQ